MNWSNLLPCKDTWSRLPHSGVWLLSISKAGNSTSCLGSLFQCSVTLTALPYVQSEPPVFLSVPIAPFPGRGLCLLHTLQISALSACPHMSVPCLLFISMAVCQTLEQLLISPALGRPELDTVQQHSRLHTDQH